jgi:hypothetical protein
MSSFATTQSNITCIEEFFKLVLAITFITLLFSIDQFNGDIIFISPVIDILSDEFITLNSTSHFFSSVTDVTINLKVHGFLKINHFDNIFFHSSSF